MTAATFAPGDIVAQLVTETPSLADHVRSVVDPIRTDRARIREHFESQDAIDTLDQTLAYHPLGATDGSYLTGQAVAGDFLATLSVATSQDPTGAVSIHGHRHWSDFRAHNPDNDALAKAVMMLHEQTLLADLPNDTIKIIDGSHVTPLIAICLGLASPQEATREHLIDLAMAEDLADVVTTIAQDDKVVACPKSDSSLDLWRDCSTALGLSGHPLPDKALATLILEPGEVLSHNRTPPDSWRHLAAVESRVTDRRAQLISGRLATAIAPLRDGQVTVHHAKPVGGANVIRVETHPGQGFAEPALLASVTASVHTPFIQEPLVQHLADLFVKNLSTLTDVQMEETRLALAEHGDPAYLEYLTNYRTN